MFDEMSFFFGGWGRGAFVPFSFHFLVFRASGCVGRAAGAGILFLCVSLFYLCFIIL